MVMAGWRVRIISLLSSHLYLSTSISPHTHLHFIPHYIYFTGIPPPTTVPSTPAIFVLVFYSSPTGFILLQLTSQFSDTGGCYDIPIPILLPAYLPVMFYLTGGVLTTVFPTTYLTLTFTLFIYRWRGSFTPLTYHHHHHSFYHYHLPTTTTCHLQFPDDGSVTLFPHGVLPTVGTFTHGPI